MAEALGLDLPHELSAPTDPEQGIALPNDTSSVESEAGSVEEEQVY